MRARILADGVDETAKVEYYSFPEQMPIPGIGTLASLKIQFPIEFYASELVGTITFAFTAREAVVLANKILAYCGDSKRT